MDKAFYGCSWLKTVNINAATIHGYSFLNCSDIENINIKADRIGYHSFEDAKNLKSTVIDAKEIGEWAFSGCSALTNVTLNNTVRIERHAFQYCDELKMLDIPDSSPYDPSNKILYEKVDKSTAYDKMMDEVKPYFMGIQAGPNRFKHEGGCCAGIAIIQNLAMTGILSRQT